MQLNKHVNNKHPNEYTEALSHEEDNFVKANLGFEDIDDMFQIEGEPVYACNICNEEFDQVDEVKKHIEEDHNEILMQISKALEENERRKLDDDSMTSCNVK